MMKKSLVCLLLCVLFIPLLGMKGGTGEGVVRCLLIGCDRFVSMPGTEPAGANNVDTMEALLGEFLPEDTVITRRVNGPGTVQRFEWLVTETFREAKSADTALIYISTHGIIKNSAIAVTQIEDLDNSSTIQNPELIGEQTESESQMALLLSDGETEEQLTPEKLREILDRIAGEKVLILDACHSGAVIGCGKEKGFNWLEDDSCRVLVSSGAEEDSWFWSTETDEYTGTGYFTAAMDSALRASDAEQIDPDGNGGVSLAELTARLREIHGASTVYCWPEENREPLFRLPADRKPGNRLQGVGFGEPEPDGESVVLPIRFRTAEEVRVMYQMVPSRNGKWDFESAVRLPDRERTRLIRGLISPGEKERKIRISRESLGNDRRVLLQIVTLYGNSLIPIVEAGRVVRSD